MKKAQPQEKAKPFRLVKYFTFTSLSVLFIGTIILSLFNAHWARAIQQNKSEDYALLLIENLNHQVFLQFLIPTGLKYGKITLRKKEQFEHLDKVVRSTLHSFKIDMVNIYDPKNIISYSFDKILIGKKNVGGSAFQKALAGKSTSRLVQNGNWFEIFLGFPPKSKIITIAPLRAEKSPSRLSGPILGVVEIVQDLSKDYKEIFRFQIRILLTSTAVMGVLFLILFFTVKRGENIISQRAQEQLKLKEQLSRAEHMSTLGEMVAGISHEIRNPLGIIKSSAELLKKKHAALDSPSTIPDIIVEESERLNYIITDFLNFAKPRDPNIIPCRIEEIVQKNLTFLEPQLKNHAYQINSYFAPGLSHIMADPDMLYQAFLNILINAMQAIPEEGKIDIKTNKKNNRIVIIFEDNGSGVPQDLLKKIWDPFFTTKEKGTGLGLGIVKNIIEAHDGRIRIANAPVRGTRVTIELPANKEV